MATAGQTYGAARERRHRSLVGPIILIGLGLLFLGQNLGYINGHFWLNIWRFWPVLLILGGVDLIFGRAGWAGALITAFVTVAVLAVVAWAAVAGSLPYWTGSNWWFGSAAGVAAIEQVSEEVGSVRQATVDLRHNAGRLQISALPAESSRLVEGALAHPDNASIYRRFDRRGEQAELRLRDADNRDFPFVANTYDEKWDLRLSPAVTYDLLVETGASALNLDLRSLKVASLRIQAGASAVDVVLPEAAGRTSATIKAGAAGVDVTVPEGVAARILTRGGLSGVSVDEHRFPRTGAYYQSRDYESAAHRVDLTIDTGVSGVSIH